MNLIVIQRMNMDNVSCAWLVSESRFVFYKTYKSWIIYSWLINYLLMVMQENASGTLIKTFLFNLKSIKKNLKGKFPLYKSTERNI